MQDNNPLVTVIIPIHNRFDLASQAINSVILQSYRPIQLILIDDASDIPFQFPKVNSFDLERITIELARSEVNSGPGISRELGRQKARGDFVCYLDSDDLWHEQKISKQVEKMIQTPLAGMCYCTSAQFSQSPISGLEIIRRRSNQSFEEFLPTILEGRPWDTSACMWRRSAVEIIGPWSSSWAWEDYEYDCRAGCNNIRIIHVNEVLSYYRKNHGETQLSKENGKIRITQRATSLIEMENNLRIFGKFSNNTIRKIMSQKLYFLALNLFYEKDEITARILIEKSAKLQNGYKGFIINFLVKLLNILPARFLYRILYRIRILL